jgi:uncharacterized protein (DUF427 family)
MPKTVRITHEPSGALIAEGPVGWGITPFEGNFYVRRKYLRDGRFKVNHFPGLCPYKFLYTWMDYYTPDGNRVRSLGWMYWLPNPLFPFIWYRVAVPRHHPEIRIEYRDDTA